jgi:hypothetical protein
VLKYSSIRVLIRLETLEDIVGLVPFNVEYQKTATDDRSAIFPTFDLFVNVRGWIQLRDLKTEVIYIYPNEEFYYCKTATSAPFFSREREF